MHEKDKRRVKKRKEEGVLGLPLSQSASQPSHEGVESGDQDNDIRGATTPSSQPVRITHTHDEVYTSFPTGPSHHSATTAPEPDLLIGGSPPSPHGPHGATTSHADLREIYDDVIRGGMYNFQGARRRVPSGLCIEAWKRHLSDYHDTSLVTFLEFGWPINFNRDSPIQSTFENHGTAVNFEGDLDYYIQTELGHNALAGPFRGPPVVPMHLSPLMTRTKKDSTHRRVIMDLSWPPGAAINDGVNTEWYFGEPINIKLPTVEFMECRLLSLGRGAYMFKTDLARGYRQLRVDPTDWPLLGFQHGGNIYMDICPPFGLKTSAMFMQRTSEAVTHIHGKAGYNTRSYLDDFGGAESTHEGATSALESLQAIMAELGLEEALHKVCPPAQTMIWLGILFNSVEMTMRIPPEKMDEIKMTLESWEGKKRATLKELQSLMGTLNFVASVSPPARIFTNRMLEVLREAPKRGTETLSAGFKADLRFFLTLWPDYNGLRILEKHDVACQAELELDACLTGCGAYAGTHYYSERFPESVLRENHPIAHLELLNVVVATKVWAKKWTGQRVRVDCDNTNACLAIQSGRTRDPYMQRCAREIFMVCTVHDIELRAVHKPGAELHRADALSRAHTDPKFVRKLEQDAAIQAATRVRVNDDIFKLVSEL